MTENLPPLPTQHVITNGLWDEVQGPYTADQMCAYAADAVQAEREACAKVCDKFAEGTLASQSGNPDALSNLMLRQVATLGHAECAAAIRARGTP